MHQTNTQRGRILRKDNKGFFHKITLRRQFTNAATGINLYLPACGCGVMFEQVWQDKANYVLALDMAKEKVGHFRYRHPTVDVRVADINTFSDWPENVKFSIADFDVYGSPYKAISNFLHARVWATPLYIIVTDGIPLWLGRSGFLPAELTGEKKSVRVLGLEARNNYFEAIIWPWWTDLAARLNLSLKEYVVLWKKGKCVVYYALKLTSSG